MNDKGYHRLIIWQKGKEFVKQIYQKTEQFPRSEIFGLQSQIRRAALSFLLTIVEGQRRNSLKDYLHFLNISEGSLVEVEACLELSQELGFLSKTDYDVLDEVRRELAVMLQALIKTLKKKTV